MKAALSNIFVTVGSASQDFSRLIRKMDELTPNLGAKVVMQIGYTKYEPKNAEHFRFAPSLSDYIRHADLVISQGGMTPIEVIRAAKPVIVVPRQSKYGEVINDHQCEFARALAKKRGVAVVYDVDELQEAIGRVGHKVSTFELDDSNRVRLVNKLREFVQVVQAKSE